MSRKPSVKKFVTLALLYNAFDPSTVEHHEIAFTPKGSLADHLGQLPVEAEWRVGLNGVPVAEEDFAHTLVAANDIISVVQVPTGGGAGKQILQVIAMVAVVVAAMVIPGAIGLVGAWAAVAGASIAVVGSTLISLAFKPKGLTTSGEKDTASYGIDGEKNTSSENISVPVIYGEYRVAGNLCDVYTKNNGDTQYIFMRSVLNDGRIEGVYDIEINEQPASTFKDVETKWTVGALTEGVNEWFTSAIREVNKGQKFADTGWLTHTTVSNVDRVRFDIVFPNGLVTVSEKKGTFSANSVSFTMEYRKSGTSTWLPYGQARWESILGGGGTTATVTATNTIRVQVLANTTYGVDSTVTVEYRKVGTTPWQTMGTANITNADYAGQTGNAFGVITGISVAQNVGIPKTFTAFDLNGDYEIRVTGGKIRTIDKLTLSTNNVATVTDNRTKATRHTFEGGIFPEGRGTYDLRIKRNNAPSTNKFVIDDVWLTDIGEIDVSPVALRGTATLSVKALLTEQLSSMPQITARVRGCLLQEYDVDGNPTVERWSANPAWIVIDILSGWERGRGYVNSRINWPKIVEWANDCDTYGWKFNGLFKEGSNVADALRAVMTAGHAMPQRIGTKFSVSIDKPELPSMVFGSGSIIQDTFSIAYLPTNDRANEFEVTFFDKNNRNKARTLRIVDPTALARGEPSRTASFQLPGVDNSDQAQKEVWRYLYANRLINRTISFDAPMEAISCAIGDVVLVAHDSVNWAETGRLEEGSTTTVLNLDKSVTMEAGKTYGAIVTFSARQVATMTVSSIIGRKINVSSTSSLVVLPITRVRRPSGDADDYEVTDVTSLGGNNYQLRLGSSPATLTPGMTLAAWSTDEVFERDVAFSLGETTNIGLTSALPLAPEQYTSWIFGEKATMKHPYRVKAISGDSVHRRTLTMIEYNEGVYAAPGFYVPIPTTAVSTRVVGRARNVSIDYEPIVGGDKNIVQAHVSWSASGIIDYAGADIHMSLNEGEFRPVASQPLVSDYAIAVGVGDRVAFKIVPFNSMGDRANYDDAQIVTIDIVPTFLTLDPPTTPTYNIIYGVASATVFLGATPPLLSAPLGYEFQYRKVGDTNWQSLGVDAACAAVAPNLAIATYDFRARSVRGQAFSNWLTFTVDVAKPNVRASVTALTLDGNTGTSTNGIFSGTDASFRWSQAARTDEQDFAFKDYEVRIYSPTNALLRTEYVTSPAYIYTFDKNVADSIGSGVTARRQFSIDVRERNRFGGTSGSATMSAQNSVPGALTIVTDVSFAFAQLRITRPSDTDFAGVKVWMSTTSPVAKTTGNLVHDGDAGSITIKTASNTTYYFRVAAYDTFLDGSNGTEATFSLTTLADPTSAADVTPPDVPTGLVVTSTLVTETTGEQFVKLVAAWNEATAADRSSYEIAISEASGSYITYPVGRPESGSVVTFELPNVRKNVSYSAKVRALDYYNNTSAWSTVVAHTTTKDTTAPAVPTSGSVTAAFKSFYLQWTNPTDTDFDTVEVWEHPTTLTLANVATTATKVATLLSDRYFRSGLAAGVTRFYWVRAVDTSGNASAFVAIGSGTTLTVQSGEIAAAAITAANIVAGTITATEIAAATLTGALFSPSTNMPATITVGGTGVSIGTIQSQAANPAAGVNSGSTLIAPGKIQLFGTTSLTSWLNGSDNTKIEGGAIAANTITANKLEIGSRGLTFEGVEFQSTTSTNTVSWTSGSIRYTADNGALTTATISSGSAVYSGNRIYIYWVKGDTSLSTTTTVVTSMGADRVCIATYSGAADLIANYGRTIVDGANITTGSINLDRLKANTAVVNNIFVGGTNFALNGAYGGAGKGALVITNGTVEMVKLGWLDSTRLGFELRNSAGTVLLSNATVASDIYNSSVTFSGLADRPTSLAGINSTEGSKLSGIAPGATVGATWGDNIGGQPSDDALLNANVGASNMLYGAQNGPQSATDGTYGIAIATLKSGSSNPHALQPGEWLTISTDLRQDAASLAAGQNATLYLYAANSSGWTVAAPAVTYSITPTRITATMQLPSTLAGMDFVGVGLWHQGGTTNTVGTVNADRIQVERGKVATQYKPGAQPGADVTASNTAADTANVNGVAASTVTTNVANAVAALSRIASDSYLTAGEKPVIKEKWAAIYNEYLPTYTSAYNLGLWGSGNAAVWDAAFSALSSYLSSLTPAWDNTSLDTAIVSATFQGKFTDYYYAKALLDADIKAALKSRADAAATTATWTGVTGAGKPQDNATVGANAGNFTGKIGAANLVRNSNGQLGGWNYGISLINDTGDSVAVSVGTGINGGKSFVATWATSAFVQMGFALTNSGGVDNTGLFKADTDYVFSYEAKATGSVVGKTMTVESYPIFPSVTALSNPPLTTAYQRYVFRVRYAGTAASYIRAYIAGAAIPGGIEITNIKVEEGDVATAFVAHTSESQWSAVYGTGKPQDNATVGATWGANISGQPANDLIYNSSVRITSNGQLQYWNGSSYVGIGTTTLTGLGAGAMAFINGLNSGNIGTYMANATISDALIANLSAAKITTGVLSADRIDARTINASKITLNGVDLENINRGQFSGYSSDSDTGISSISVSTSIGTTVVTDFPGMGGTVYVGPGGTLSIEMQVQVAITPPSVAVWEDPGDSGVYAYVLNPDNGSILATNFVTGTNLNQISNTTFVNASNTTGAFVSWGVRVQRGGTNYQYHTDPGQTDDVLVTVRSAGVTVSRPTVRVRWSAF